MYFFISIKGIKNTTDDESEDEFYPLKKSKQAGIYCHCVDTCHWLSFIDPSDDDSDDENDDDDDDDDDNDDAEKSKHSNCDNVRVSSSTIKWQCEQQNIAPDVSII